jgi:hypothetical protein
MSRHLEVPAHHQRVIAALQAGGPAMPDHLLPGVQALQVRPARRTWGLRPALAGGLAAALAIVVAVVLSLSGSRDSGVVTAAGLSERPSTQTAQRSFAGITYADWGARFRWFKVGGRTDVVEGRRTSTVFYRHTHHRIAYTVFAGRPIEPPDDAAVLRANGLELHRFKLGTQDVVTWVRNGRTCVLSGDVHNPFTLVKLAINS